MRHEPRSCAFRLDTPCTRACQADKSISCELDEIELAAGLAREDHPPPPSEATFRQRVRDLEAAAHANALAARRMVKLIESQAAENARLRRALRVLAKMQPARVRDAMMEVIRDA